jgi:hypothetical protein
MNATWALIRRDARDSRFSLLAAPIVSAAVLGVIHVAFRRPFAEAQAAAMAAMILIPLWTLFFAADLFATDCASGRMSTKALLPVSALTLWTAKVLFLVMTITGLSASILGAEFVLQQCAGTPESLAHFATQLRGLYSPQSGALASLVVLLASTAVLCSMLVENALVAMLLSLIVVAAFAGAAWALDRALSLAGIELGGAHWLALILMLSAVLLGVGATSFVRGQRKLGLRVVRTRFAFATLGALVFTSGVGTAAVVYHGVMSVLDHPHTQFVAATASPDGRHLALIVETAAGRVVESTYVVWMIDLDTGRRDFVASPGMLVSDRYSGEPMPWDADGSLRVIGLTTTWGSQADLLRVEATNAGVAVAPVGGDLPLTSLWVPPWAEVTRTGVASAEKPVLHVRWKERALERTFTGDGMGTWLGRGVYVSPTPGRLLVLREGCLTLVDLAPESSRVLFERGVKWMRPSPDGSALLIGIDSSTYALSGIDGAPLHEPWSEAPYVQWVSGEGPSRAVRVGLVGSAESERIVDLDTHVEFDARVGPGHWFLHHLGDRGYVYVDEKNDLIWVDAKGALVKVLVDR